MAKADLTVNGRRYSIVCAPGREARLGQLAMSLDGRIRAIADAVGDVGEERLLLIAALALLDDLEAAKAHIAPDAREQRAAAALDKAAERIEDLAKRIEDGA
ncbi:MAG: cell division protein ZapA [Pseudomonadota bacterium]